MFGFLNPLEHNAEFRRARERCRQELREHYGRRVLPFLSFEAVFVYLAWSDACGDGDDAEIARLCASAGLLLASIKLDDDVRDGASMMAKAARMALRAPFAAARAHVLAIDERAGDDLEQILDRHLALEAHGGSVPLSLYVQPTAEAFGRAFALAAPVSFESFFAIIGRHVGAALIAFDCALDWRRDRARGEPNPLPDEHAVAAAFAFARRSLVAAHRLCSDRFGQRSRTAQTVLGVIHRLERRLGRRWSFARAVFAPVGSHIDSSAIAELRDKIWFCCQLVVGALIDRIAPPPTPR